MKILVLRGGALGDFIVTVPALALLREKWPEARIELVGNASAARVALNRFHLDAAHSQHDARWSALGSGSLTKNHPLATWIATFDLVVNFWPDPDGALAAEFAALGFNTAGARRYLAAPAKPARGPASAHFCRALRPLGITAPAPPPRIHVSDDDRAAAKALSPECDRDTIAWHPGSGSPEKNWPLERWTEVIRRRLALRPARLVVTLGEAEAGLETDPRFRAWLPDDCVVLRNTPPHHLAAIYERCSLFLGHDTGPSHIAAAVGCPCLLVFGPSDPEVWAPPHPHVRVVRRGVDITSVSVADVLAVL